MNSYILLIFEGEKTEKQIFDSLQNYYFKDINGVILKSAFCSDIYSLYHKMQNDPYLDLFQLVKEIEQNKLQLANILRNQVSEIFLFFDYDGHASAASDNKLEKLLNHFDEETENGKLYISYPMVEAFKHIHTDIPFEDLVVNAKTNIGYKKIVHHDGDACYADIAALSQLHWSTLIGEHCKKINFLMTNSFRIPSQLTTQIDAFQMQKRKHIIPHSEVAVLCSFPIFIADYYGYSSLRCILKRR